MTDDDIERALRRFRISSPPADLRRRVRVLADRQRTRRDACGGCAVAAAVVVLACLGSCTSWAAWQRRLNQAQLNPAVAQAVDEASRVLGPDGRVLALLNALERVPADVSALDAMAPGGRRSW